MPHVTSKDLEQETGIGTRPVNPIIPKSNDPGEKMREITERLEQGDYGFV